MVVSVLDHGIQRQHPALEPNYVSVLDEDGALGASIRKRSDRRCGRSFLGRRLGKASPDYWCGHETAGPISRWDAEDAARELLASSVVMLPLAVSLIQDQLASLNVDGADRDASDSAARL